LAIHRGRQLPWRFPDFIPKLGPHHSRVRLSFEPTKNNYYLFKEIIEFFFLINFRGKKRTPSK
jgi:hypothetical protein